jgi:hypothetical protein
MYNAGIQLYGSKKPIHPIQPVQAVQRSCY